MVSMNARDRLISTASNLMCEKGIKNVGISEIIKTANVAKMTLYNNFDSKEALILAVLNSHLDSRRAMIKKAFQETFSTIEKLERLFAIASTAQRIDNFRGCVFINFATQMSDPESPVHALVCKHKIWIKDRIRDALLPNAENDDAETRAQQILMMWDGAILEAYIQQSSVAIDYGLAAAKELLISVDQA